ncbi:putative fasciclin-like arabinogalactan protein 20 [Alnus glutinosa]|uniref:putative fasciclin-like arabinogalactan protein 20 n=1 Tax=Alnus glutinosa TaxID=3517 RepID=UPI002D794F41|nr:putative fasciclin-like arabinogalactan protein 20 [Alnus glutinosa]
MASPILLLLSLILFSVFSLSSPIPAETIGDAADILADSGYLSMSLILEAVSNTLLPNSSYLTIFAPADGAFVRSGQPSLSLLQFHFSLLPLPLETLKSLPYAAKIPTLFATHSLTVTTSPSDDRISLNNLMITGSPIFDDGLLIIHGIDQFFDPNFNASVPVQIPGSNLGCGFSTENGTVAFSGDYSFRQASGVLRSSGYSVMAEFLDVQVPENKERTMMTVFAPVDEAMLNRIGNFSEYSSIFLRHIVPCRLLWNDLVKFDDGTALVTYLEGFTINSTRCGDVLMLNGVPVFYPNMYISDWLVVHGLRKVLELPERSKEAVGVPSKENVPGNCEERAG